MMRRSVLVVFALAVGVAACAGKKAVVPADDLWKEANEHYDSEAWEYSVKTYKQLLDQYPFDPHAEEASLKIAQAYYRSGRYQEAIASFGDFQRMHPTSDSLALVQYHIGLAYLAQASTSDRDQEPIRQALTYFANLVDRYPSSPWTEKARLRQKECRESLAKHHRDIAAWYLRHDNLRAAEARLAELVRDYPETDAAAEALDQFADVYAKHDDKQSAALARAALLSHHPDGPLAAKAREELGGRGPTGDAVPQLLDRLVALRDQPDRQKASRTVSAYPTLPVGSGAY